ncbi:uncharacterized protein LOC132300347 isoform X2 [Cornus florida]|uniref:uncharacterized protein LOC132300347 isoform X2 n=1 Tax=Cornus florida TaxID=4283 RepID=UPI002897A772|nr:uncharacterized protein LOC132300347 isoform X2 [Cornus florida]
MMDRIIYKAAAEGNIDVLITQNADQLEGQVTPQKNTVLHVAAQFGQTDCVKVILDKCGQSLLCSVNNKGDSSLHISSRDGYADVVWELIKYAKKDMDPESRTRTTKKMLRLRNVEGDTALHEAVRNENNVDVVEILTREDSKFEHPPNNAEETPLFLAAERGNSMIVSKFLENCRSPTYSGPNGRTALHAATIHGYKECVKILYLLKPSLTKEADVYGWRPLHYAAWIRNPSMVRQLLDLDESVAYLVADEDDNKTSLHIAVSRGNVKIMNEILSRCPDCWEMINTRAQNILHIAVEHDEQETIKFILENSFGKKLINQKDTDGNTPFHIAAANHSIYWKYWELFSHLGDKKACNKKNLMVKETRDRRLREAPEGSRNKFEVPKKEEAQKRENKKKKEFTKLGDTALIVAGLIATVTFTAGFTVPGGFESDDGVNKGMAVLGRRTAFIAFALTDTIAMLLSIIAVFLLLISFTYTYNHDEDERIKRQVWAFWLITAAMGAMVVAFMTGFYATLEPSLGLSITICLICFVFFPISFFVFWKRINEGIDIDLRAT